MTIGTKTYTARVTPSVEGDVKIGDTIEEFVANLRSASDALFPL